jgi:NAD(P)-dependent dehydrogenase (short-subunit alcohol dehydrogenase family)
LDVKDKVMVITGGASGIGAALARRAAGQGARVCVADLNIEAAEALAREIGGLGLACNVANEAEVQSLVAQAEERLGPVDIFVSNAGFGRGDPSHAASASNEDWQLNWDVHVMAHVYAARALLPGMIDRGSGYFVNVASAAGLLNQIADAAYSATKHAAVSFAESIAITHGADGIGVSVVCPQYVATPLIGLSDADAEGEEALLTADDVADCILSAMQKRQFLVLPHPQVAQYAQLRAGDHDRWITGMQMLRAKAFERFGRPQPQDFYKLM